MDGLRPTIRITAMILRRRFVQEAFKSWQLPERAPRPPPPPHVTQPFDATSAYQDSYPNHEPQPRWRRQQEVYKGEYPPEVTLVLTMHSF